MNQFSQKEAKELVDRDNTVMLDLIKELALRNASHSMPKSFFNFLEKLSGGLCLED